MISEEELQWAGRGRSFAVTPSRYRWAGLSQVNAEMLRIMHYHPQQKNFPDLQIYFFIQFCNQFF